MEHRDFWQNCFGSNDESFLFDAELLAIDAMANSVAPLDEQTMRIRPLITRFEACYHQADKEAEYLIKCIASGQELEQSSDRPPERQKELADCHHILSKWCKAPEAKPEDISIADLSAVELLSFIGSPSRLKIWQVERIVDRIAYALDPEKTYHNMALDLGPYGEPGAVPAGEHYKDNAEFLERTVDTLIHYTENDKPAEISIALAIDLLMPCYWDFVGLLGTILKAIGGDLRPVRPLGYCGINIEFSPLCGRLATISRTLKAFWKPEEASADIDEQLLARLGEPTDKKRWLAASLDKTIRLHLHI